MELSVTVPNEIAQRLSAEWQDLPRAVLEAVAVEAYRTGVITSAEVQQMLNLTSRWETEQFLAARQVYLDYTEADLQTDIETIRKTQSQ